MVTLSSRERQLAMARVAIIVGLRLIQPVAPPLAALKQPVQAIFMPMAWVVMVRGVEISAFM